jgi:hypothetical protein
MYTVRAYLVSVETSNQYENKIYFAEKSYSWSNCTLQNCRKHTIIVSLRFHPVNKRKSTLPTYSRKYAWDIQTRRILRQFYSNIPSLTNITAQSHRYGSTSVSIHLICQINFIRVWTNLFILMYSRTETKICHFLIQTEFQKVYKFNKDIQILQILVSGPFWLQ